MKKVGILIENYFDDEELIYPYHRLKEDFEVLLIGTEGDVEYKSKSGFTKKSDVASSEVKAEDLAGIFIPGGYSPDYMRRSEASRNLVKDLHEAGKPIGVICHGGWMLASSIDLKGLKMTSYHAIKDDIVHAGADWVDEETVVDRVVYSGRSPEDLYALLPKFVEALKK